MLDNSAVICILVRDCEKSISDNIKKIERLQKLFIESWIVVVENDSKDNSRALLEEWKRNNNSVYLPEVDIPDLASLERIERMSKCRNVYLDFIKDNSIKPDFLIVIDFDIVFDIDYFESSINNAPSDWSAIFANGVYYWEFLRKKFPLVYYDLYAYLPLNCKEKQLKQQELFYNADKILKQIKKNKYFECSSAFGGIGIYKYEYIKNCKYSTIPNTRSQLFKNICEHISINEECSKHGKLYICSTLPVWYEKITGVKKIFWFAARKIFGLKKYYFFRKFYMDKIKHKPLVE